MGLSSSCSRLTAENEHLTTAHVIEKMTSGTYRPSPHTNTLTHSVQIILIICHLRIRGASPHCHLKHQPAAASEYTGKGRDVEVTSIKMRPLASSYARNGIKWIEGRSWCYIDSRVWKAAAQRVRSFTGNTSWTHLSSEEKINTKNQKIT